MLYYVLPHPIERNSTQLPCQTPCFYGPDILFQLFYSPMHIPAHPVAKDTIDSAVGVVGGTKPSIITVLYM